MHHRLSQPCHLTVFTPPKAMLLPSCWVPCSWAYAHSSLSKIFLFKMPSPPLPTRASSCGALRGGRGSGQRGRGPSPVSLRGLWAAVPQPGGWEWPRPAGCAWVTLGLEACGSLWQNTLPGRPFLPSWPPSPSGERADYAACPPPHRLRG